MKKPDFISQIKPMLKELNYRKNGNYWYKIIDNHICCINVQGSQWDKDDYYVEIGFSVPAIEHKNPKLLEWYCRHRCQGVYGEKNILPKDLLDCLDNVFEQVKSTSQIVDFLNENNAVKVISQYWF